MEGEGALRAPRRVHLQALADGGDLDAEAELAAVPPLKPQAEYLWGYFLDIAQTRQAGGAGPSPISRREIHAWERDEYRTLAPWERRTILRIDAAFLASGTPKIETPTETHQPEETP